MENLEEEEEEEDEISDDGSQFSLSHIDRVCPLQKAWRDSELMMMMMMCVSESNRAIGRKRYTNASPFLTW